MGKKLRVNGFWLFAQTYKRIKKDDCSFGEFVLKASPQWDALSPSERLQWNNKAKELRETHLHCLLRSSKEDIKSATEEDWKEIHKLTYKILIIFAVKWAQL